jgi:hypothetical protein
MVGETELSFNDCLSVFALVHTLSEKIRVLIKEEERETSNKLLLTSCEDLHLVLSFFVVIVKDFYWAPDILLVLENGGKGVRLIWASLAVINPLFKSLVFLPCVVTGECFHTGQIRSTVEDLHLLVENLQGLLGGLIFVCSRLDFFEKSFLANNVFVLFNNIGMSRWQALDFKLFKIHQLEK